MFTAGMAGESPVEAWVGSVTRMALWLAWFVVFYHSGLALTTWLLGAGGELGGADRALALLFPFLLVIFPRINRYCRRRGGPCRDGHRGL